MSGAAVIVLFGIACAKPCSANDPERARIDREVVRLLSERGFTVKPALESMRRPTGETASPEILDEAKAVDAERVLALDLEANGQLLWLTHFVRGVPGAWSIGRVVCAREAAGWECPELEKVLMTGLRARRATDVDFVAALRLHARLVGGCIQADDERPIDERVFGRVELDLEAQPTGSVKVTAIAPAVVAKSALGKCLRAAMETMNVGPFDGEPVRMRIPIDLD